MFSIRSAIVGAMIASCMALIIGAQSTKTTKPSDEFTIEEFEFDWIIAKSGEAKLVLEKTHEAKRVRLWEGGMLGDQATLTPKEAVIVGAVLAKTDYYWDKMKDSDKDVQEKVDAGEWAVFFVQGTKHGFSVHIKANERFSLNDIALTRLQAKEFAPHLQKADVMMEYLDKKILPDQ